METGNDIPHTSGYTINGELGYFSDCSSNGKERNNTYFSKLFLFLDWVGDDDDLCVRRND